MHIASVDKLEPGNVLGKSLFDDQGDLLIASGFTLSLDTIRNIQSGGFGYAYIMDDQEEGLCPEKEIRSAVKRTVHLKVSKADMKGVNIQALQALSVQAIEERLEEFPTWAGNQLAQDRLDLLIKQVERLVEQCAAYYLALPENSVPEREYLHALDTTILAILVGRAYELNDRDLRALTVATFLHDLGRLVLPWSWQKEPGELTRGEKMLLREHPCFSLMILRGTDPGTITEQMIVLHHHEQVDGRGYPQGLRGTTDPPTMPRTGKQKMHRLAEILSVVNAFDDAVLGLLDTPPITPFEAIRSLAEKMPNVYNPHIVGTLCQILQRFPEGSHVRIRSNTSGRHVGFQGVVKKANESDSGPPAFLITLTHNATGTPLAPLDVNFKDERHMILEVVQ